MIIYCIRNNINGKAYIGRAKKDTVYGSQCRVSLHLKGRGSKLVASAVAKYGAENFSVEILYSHIEYNNDLLNEMEIHYIAKYNSVTPCGYNITKGGEGVDGYKHSQERKEKIRCKKIGKNPFTYMSSDDYKNMHEKIGQSRKGVNPLNSMTEEAKILRSKRISDESRTRCNTPEWKAMVSERAHKRWHINRGLIKEDCIYCKNTKACQH